MEKKSEKNKPSFKEKIRDYAVLKGHYLHPTKEDHLREIDLLVNQAVKRNGMFHKSKFVGRSYFIFKDDDLDLKVGIKLVGRGDNDFRTDTYVKIKFNLTSKFRLSVYIKDASFFLTGDITNYPNFRVTQSLLGLKNFETLSNDFNEKFIVKTNDEAIAVNILKYDIQNLLLDLESEYFYPVVNITNKEFLLVAHNRLNDEKEYDALIDTALLFLNRLKGLGLIDLVSKVEK